LQLNLASMGKEDFEAIEATSLEVLSNVGVKFPNRAALDALDCIGAKIDRKTMIARFAEEDLKQALSLAPKEVKLCARNPAHDLRLMTGHVNFCPSGCGVYVYDTDTRQRRLATKADAMKFALVADALANYHLVQVSIMPSDVPPQAADQHRFLAGLTNSSKHISNVIAPGTTAETARGVIQMAAAVVGGREELRKRPIISVHQEPISPLQYDENGLNVLIEYAKAGVPISLYSLSMGGATAPVTVAGQLVIINAEILAGIALIQAINPGCPVLYGASASVMDLMTGALAMGAPERALIMVGVINLARFYGFPSMPAALNTEASMPGSQAAFEKMVSTLPLVLAGADVIFGGGTFDSANTYSLDQLVIDDEMCGAMLRVARGFETSADTLASDTIKTVGIGGHFLAQPHTLKHGKDERWFPTLYKRVKKTEAQWSLETMSRQDLATAAKEKVDTILRTHKPQPLSKETHRTINDMVATSERQKT
jgi:trimethylamine--corrinoid protein Co-methyltransferase